MPCRRRCHYRTQRTTCCGLGTVLTLPRLPRIALGGPGLALDGGLSDLVLVRFPGLAPGIVAIEVRDCLAIGTVSGPHQELEFLLELSSAVLCGSAPSGSQLPSSLCRLLSS